MSVTEQQLPMRRFLTQVPRMVLRGGLSLVFRTSLALFLLLVVTIFCVVLMLAFEPKGFSDCIFLQGGLLRECKAEIAQRNVEWANTPAMNFTFYVAWPAMCLAVAFWFFQGLLHRRNPEEISS